MPDGVVLQDLPFDVELKKFIVEYYDTGMPKLFASEIVIHDHDTGSHRGHGQGQRARIPPRHHDLPEQLRRRRLAAEAARPAAGPSGQPFEVAGHGGRQTSDATSAARQAARSSTPACASSTSRTSACGAASAAPTCARSTWHHRCSHLGSGAKPGTKKALRNVGPSVTYKLRDAAGQAREFQNYMLPVELDGQRVFLAGVRDTPGEPFRYLRIPADDEGSMDDWLRLRRADDPHCAPGGAPLRATWPRRPTGPRWPSSCSHGPARPGAVRRRRGARQGRGGHAPGGRRPAGAGEFIETSVPEAERARISRCCCASSTAACSSWPTSRARRPGQNAAAPGRDHAALHDPGGAGAVGRQLLPGAADVQLKDFKQVQASVFQVARAPGKNLVYLGAVLLIVGVFAMLYIRERRLWIWLAPEAGGCHAHAPEHGAVHHPPHARRRRRIRALKRRPWLAPAEGRCQA
jgi:cytochrome c biogenesis protein